MTLENEIYQFGEKIFNSIGQNAPSGFGKKGLASKLMQWSMTKPSLKTNLFRLVDVLPALTNSDVVAKHVHEYLGEDLTELGPMFKFGMKLAPGLPSVTNIAVKKSVKEMAQMFIVGETPEIALPKLKNLKKNKLAFTVDLLGEYSVSEEEAEIYLKRYLHAIKVFGEDTELQDTNKPIFKGHPGCIFPSNVSVKLTALYSQCTPLNFAKSVEVLSKRLSTILKLAMKNKIGVYIDAEDSEHNPIIYETIKKVYGSEEFLDFPFPGLVIQAYAKDSLELTKDILDFAKRRGKPVAIRLVKGAYWDSETASSELHGWENPLFIKKEKTDANYEKITKLLLENVDICLPAIGSHNIRSLSHACCYAEKIGVSKDKFELQMLYGMADPIAKAFVGEGYLARMYVPLGEMIPGMGYLVRRLLENTSNESFLRNTFHDQNEIKSLLKNPSENNNEIV